MVHSAAVGKYPIKIRSREEMDLIYNSTSIIMATSLQRRPKEVEAYLWAPPSLHVEV